jgi:hypothetical protein
VETFDESKYVPVMFTKRGERVALTNTPSAVKERLRPLFVVQPLDWDYENDRPQSP